MKTHINLQSYNSFGFNVIAKQWVEINDARELDRLLRSPEYKKEKHLVLSGGNNILFTSDFFDGIVIHVNNKGIKTIADDGDKVIVRVQAGEDWPEFVKQMVGRGLHGIENLAHIPGKVGAAPVQNICAYGMDLFQRRGKLWQRSFEEHLEYAYTLQELTDYLREAGFAGIRVYGDCRMDPPAEGEQRVYFSACKE